MSPQDAERLKAGDSIHCCRDRGIVPHASGVQGDASTGVQVRSRGAYRVLCLLTPGSLRLFQLDLRRERYPPTEDTIRSGAAENWCWKFHGEDKELGQSVRGGLRGGVQVSLTADVRLLQAALQGRAPHLRPSLRTLRPDLKNFHKAHTCLFES